MIKFLLLSILYMIIGFLQSVVFFFIMFIVTSSVIGMFSMVLKLFFGIDYETVPIRKKHTTIND